MLEAGQKWMLIYLAFMMCTSSFVLIEPSPYDLLMLILIVSCFVSNFYKITEQTVLPVTLVSLYLISNLISFYFIEEQFTAIRYSGITFYLVISWLCLVSVGHHFKQSALRMILSGYFIAAMIAVLIGTSAYLTIFPMYEEFLLFGRVKSTFKDPNVFGPFLILPAIFALSLTELKETKWPMKMIGFLSFLLLTLGIILSYSRAAWGNFALSLFLYIVIVKRDFLKRRIKTICMILLIGFPVFLFMIQLPAIQDLFTSRLMMKSYDSDRFATQKEAFETGLFNPFGIGPGHSELLFQYAPHSLYARVFTENGLLGIVSLVLFLFLSIYRAFKNYWQSTNEYAIFFLAIFASLCGLLFNSFFIDTLHWRHFWLVLALAYFPIMTTED